jgi:hypothetical protein
VRLDLWKRGDDSVTDGRRHNSEEEKEPLLPQAASFLPGCPSHKGSEALAPTLVTNLKRPWSSHEVRGTVLLPSFSSAQCHITRGHGTTDQSIFCGAMLRRSTSPEPSPSNSFASSAICARTHMRVWCQRGGRRCVVCLQRSCVLATCAFAQR